MTPSQVEITPDLVTDLLREQRPDLADLPVRLGARGWDDQVWRRGDDLAVRLPWATGTADEQLRQEHARVPRIAPALPLPVPVPQFLGRPTERFRRPWLVTTWVPGEPADRAPATRAEEAADALAAFLTALHRPADEGAPTGGARGRGGALRDHADGSSAQLEEAVRQCLDTDPAGVRAVWEDAAAAPERAGPRVWVHGDLHPANLLTSDGTLCGVIDSGDLLGGDPAGDLAAARVLLPDGGVERFRAASRPLADAATLRRARGWAAGRALSGALIGEAGVHGRLGGKATWGPPARASMRRLLATRAA